MAGWASSPYLFDHGHSFLRSVLGQKRQHDLFFYLSTIFMAAFIPGSARTPDDTPPVIPRHPRLANSKCSTERCTLVSSNDSRPRHSRDRPSLGTVQVSFYEFPWKRQCRCSSIFSAVEGAIPGYSTAQSLLITRSVIYLIIKCGRLLAFNCFRTQISKPSLARQRSSQPG